MSYLQSRLRHPSQYESSQNILIINKVSLASTTCSGFDFYIRILALPAPSTPHEFQLPKVIFYGKGRTLIILDFYFTYEKTGAQRGEIICPKSASQSVAKPRLWCNSQQLNDPSATHFGSTASLPPRGGVSHERWTSHIHLEGEQLKSNACNESSTSDNHHHWANRTQFTPPPCKAGGWAPAGCWRLTRLTRKSITNWCQEVENKAWQ